tara:strand:- start:45 stop:485 length:441 start_codon:yes stop_codon:yes gene_type:complete
MNNINYRTFGQYDSNLLCIDNGFFEKYCPNNEYPFTNKKYFPFEFVVHESNKISPKYYYDNNNNIKIIFKTSYVHDLSEDVYKLNVLVTPVKNYDMYVHSSLVMILGIFWIVYVIYKKKYVLLWYNIVCLVMVYEYNFKGEYGYFM